MPDRTINGEVYERTLVLDRAHADDEKRTVPAALSSEVEVERWFGREQLVHDSDAVDLTRTNDGLPMLFNHNSDLPIGVIREIEIGDDRKLRGVLHFSNNAKASEVWGDVRDGFLKDISIGYRIQKWEEESDSDLVRVTRWMLHEASVVSVPADSTVGINRNLEGSSMPDTPENQGGDGSARNDDDLNIVDFQQSRERNLNEGAATGTKAERKRQSEIRRHFGKHLSRGKAFEDLQETCIERGVTVQRSTELLLEMLGREAEPLASDYQQDEYNGSMDRATARDVGLNERGQHIRMGEDSADKRVEAITQSILARTGEKVDGANPYRGMRLNEIARSCLEDAGFSTRGLSAEEYVPKSFRTNFTRAGQTTSDFPVILENTLHKMVLNGYVAHAATWQRFCRSGDVTDFRVWNRLVPGLIGNLDTVNEAGEYKNKNFPDAEKNTNQVVRRGNILNVTPEVIINDDLGAIVDMANSLGMAGSRAIERAVYTLLESNPTLSDGVALFHATHGNLAAAGAVPSVATLEAGDLAMSAQTAPGDDAELLEIDPDVAVVPRSLRGTMFEVINAEYNDDTSKNQRKPNRVRSMVSDIVGSGRLTNTTAWYLFAPASSAPVIEVVFLNGQREPRIVQEENFRTAGMAWRVELPFGVGAIDYRGAWKNPGV